MKKKYIIAALALASGLALSSNAVKADNTDKKSDIAAGSKTSADAEDSAVDAAGVSTLSDETSVGNASGDHFLNIGSVSKVYTVTAVMQLVDQGKVDLDSPLTTYIPEFRMADERYKDITVRMLMNHTAGFMGTMYGGALLCDEGSTEYHDRFLENLSIERLKYTPGEYNCYSNDGFTLQEILIEKVSGMSFTDY
ncbi:MAG TPA: serine hydrolase, partial [Lachnospiraceae bacterium]|nr:serine hydrolase [Lachnospiraceae bacterium]